METSSTPRVESADRLDGGVIIVFEDGKSAIYSASLLRAMFDQAQEIIDSDDE